MKLIESSTLTNQSLTTALLTHTYTADAAREIFIRLFADQIAGNGNYTAYVTIQRGGTGSAYRVIPITTANAASGVTAIALTTNTIPVSNGDVVKVYLLGLAGDTTTPDIITEIHESNTTLDTVWTAVKAGYLTGDSYQRIGAPVSSSIAADLAIVDGVVDAIKAKTDNLPTDPADQSLVEAAITLASSTLATTADLAVVDGIVDAIKAKTDNLPTFPASVSDIATVETNILAALPAEPDNSGIAAIKAKTDNLPDDPADQSLVEAAITAIVLDPTIALAVSKTDALGVASGDVSFTSHAQFSQSISSTSTADLSTAQKIWFALKDHTNEDDSKSLVLIEKTDGLTVVGKTPYDTASDGSLQVTGESLAWNIVITMKAAATAILHSRAGEGKEAEAKALLADGSIIVLWSGKGTISQGVIHSIS